jgi:hypothetical protein
MTSKLLTLWAYAKRHRLFCLVCLFVVRGFFCYYGYDRRPLFSSNDEVIVNDAALALARGQGLRLASFEGLELARMWAHYPPVFFLTQGAIFKAGGFCPGAVRLPGIVYSFAGVAILVLILASLHRARIIDRFGAVIAGALLFVDPYFLVISRVGRMEPLALFFGLSGIACVTCARTPLAVPMRRWIAGGALTGLAISTHPTAFLYWIAFAAFAAIAPREGIGRRVLAVVVVPGLTALLIWIAVYRGQSGVAFEQMHHLSQISLKPTLGLIDFFHAVGNRNLDEFSHAGGTTYIVLFAGWLALALRPAFQRRESNLENWRLLVFVAAGVLQTAVAWKFTLYCARAILFVPLGAINLALALSFLPKPPRRAIAIIVGAFVSLQVSLFLMYFARLPRNWNSWSPDRFDALVGSLPANRVASTFELWHAFMKANRQVRIVDFSLIPDQHYWVENPRRLEDYDTIILTESEYANKAPDASGLTDADWSRSSFHADEKNYLVFQKKPQAR